MPAIVGNHQTAATRIALDPMNRVELLKVVVIAPGLKSLTARFAFRCQKSKVFPNIAAEKCALQSDARTPPTTRTAREGLRRATTAARAAIVFQPNRCSQGVDDPMNTAGMPTEALRLRRIANSASAVSPLRNPAMMRTLCLEAEQLAKEVFTFNDI